MSRMPYGCMVNERRRFLRPYRASHARMASLGSMALPVSARPAVSFPTGIGRPHAVPDTDREGNTHHRSGQMESHAMHDGRFAIPMHPTEHAASMRSHPLGKRHRRRGRPDI